MLHFTYQEFKKRWNLCSHGASALTLLDRSRTLLILTLKLGVNVAIEINNSANSVTKHFIILKRLVETATSCVRDQDASKTQVAEKIFKLSPVHASVIIRFHEFAEFTEFLIHLGETSLYSFQA